MGYIQAFEPLAEAAPWLAAISQGSTVVSSSPTEAVLALSDGGEMTLQGEGFRYSTDGDLLGGTLHNLYLLDGDQPVLVVEDFDLSLGAMLGFLADGRPEDLAAYLFGGDDTIEGSSGDDLAAGFHGDDQIHGNDGDDTIDGGSGVDSLHGDDGDDVVFGRGGNDPIEGGAGDDLIFGNVGLDTISGGAGDDVIHGGQDYDVLHGDDGNDVLNGDYGWDDFWGDAGNDTMTGGLDGFDWFFFTSGSGQDRIDDFDVAGGDLIQIERRLNNTDIVDFASLVARVASDFHGDTIVDLGGGNYIRLLGIDAASVDERFFNFFDRGAFDPPPSDPPLLGAAA